MSDFKQDTITVDRIKKLDINKLEDFYYAAFGSAARYRFPERWEWLYINNPWSLEIMPLIYIAKKHDGDIVGHNGTMTVQCKVLSNSMIMGWSIDTFVLADFRRMGLGKRLQFINQSHNELFASLSMSEINKSIKLQINSQLGPKCVLFIYFVCFNYKNQYRIILNKISQHTHSVFAYILTLLLMPLSLVSFFFLKFMQNKSKQNKYEMLFEIDEEKARFDQDTDIFWDKARRRYDFAVERNSKYLNWRYDDIPWCNYYTLKARDENNEIIGIVIYRMASAPEHEVGIITELMDIYGNEYILSTLISETKEKLISKGAKQIFIAASDIAQIKAIKASGFIRLEEKPFVYHHKQNKITFDNNSLMLLTKGDQDWDQFPLSKECSTIKALALSLRDKLWRDKIKSD